MYMLIDLVIGVCGTLLLHLRFFEHTAARTNPAPHAVRWQYSAGTTVLCPQKRNNNHVTETHDDASSPGALNKKL
jgi:hypothetical protein